MCVTYLLKGATRFETGEKSPVVTGRDKTNIEILKFDGCIAFPAFADVHVHFREPGYSYKETIETGTAAAMAGGYTAVCPMPNLSPAPDTVANLKAQLKCFGASLKINIVPYGTITKNRAGAQLSDMQDLADSVVAFTDDGSGVQDDSVMLAAMKQAKKLGKVICAHCEDNSLLNGGYIHDGEYAKKNGHKGICSESEYKQIARDLELVKKTGCSYHVCHISAKESVELIRKAKKDGLDVTCETAPHYLVFTDMDLKEDGDFKMNPPIRAEQDRQALIAGILDGTIDMIATDHAPHSDEEKSKGLKDSLMGVVGLETAFPVLYTHLVKTGIITIEKLIELMSTNPRKRFGLQADSGDVTV
ncbi:MAG: dihydroorotase, partial [Clostridia bacterium]|nr:dihydroorotase [Clostridia bacterium]